MNKNNQFQIIQINSNLAVVSNNIDTYVCKIKGIFKHSKINKKPLVGDFVDIVEINNEWIIRDIFPRHTHIIRPSVANIDTVILVQSIIEPDFNFHLLMKFLAYYEYFVNDVILVFTKYDIASSEQLNKFNVFYQALVSDGYTVICLPNENNWKKMQDILSGKLFCLAGNSGVGKSTMINKLLPNLNLKTQEISKSLNRGKHTTTTATIVNGSNYQLMDTPGFSSIDINLLTKLELSKSYHDFKQLSLQCKYSNCLHNNEPNCAIKNAAQNKQISQLRYEQYLEILKEMK